MATTEPSSFESIRPALVHSDDQETGKKNAVQKGVSKYTTSDRPESYQTCNSFSAWLDEAVYLLIAIAALVAVVVTLAKSHDRQQPEWPNVSVLNLSAVIALLATLLRMMIDEILAAVIGQLRWHWFAQARPLHHIDAFSEATLGGWGALKFLFRIRKVNWAFLSASLSILSIGIGTFTQQAFRTVACTKAIPHAAASIPTAHTFFGDEDDEAHIPLAMKTSIVNGLSGLQSLIMVSASCETGNCSFPAHNGITHSTLGLESICFDISAFLNQYNDLTAQFTSASAAETPVWTNYSLPIDRLDDQNNQSSSAVSVQQNLGYLLNEDAPADVVARWSPLFSVVGNTVNHDFLTGLYGLNISQQDVHKIDAAIASATFMIPTLNPCQNRSSYPTSSDGNPDIESPPLTLVNTASCPQFGEMSNVTAFPGYFSVMAATCYLYPSVRQYSGSMVNGHFLEPLVGDPVPLNTSKGWAEGDSDASSDSTAGINNRTGYYAFQDPCMVDGKVYTGSRMSSVPGDWITITIDNNGGKITGPKRCLYGLDPNVVSAFSDVMAASVFKWTPNDCEPNPDYTGAHCRSSWWLEPFYHNGNASIYSINAIMTSMTNSITNQLRMNGIDWDENPSNVTGTAHQTVICLHFHWKWLLFPAGIVLLAAVILVVTAWKSRTRRSWAGSGPQHGASHRVPVWKSSPLPLLFYGLEDRVRLRHAVEEEELDKAADGMKVKFSVEEDGLRFHRA